MFTPKTFRAITLSYLWSISQCTTLWLLVRHRSAALCRTLRATSNRKQSYSGSGPTADMWCGAAWRSAVPFFSLVNCLLELLHPWITPLDCAFTMYEVENALGSAIKSRCRRVALQFTVNGTHFDLITLWSCRWLLCPRLRKWPHRPASAALTSPCTLQLIMSLFAKKLISLHRGNRLSS